VLVNYIRDRTMGPVMLTRGLLSRALLPVNARVSFVACYSSRRTGGSGRIGETSVFVQNGKKISELPVVVKKVKDVFEIYRRMGIKPTEYQHETKQQNIINAVTEQMSDEETEIIDGFNRCFNSSSIFRLLETIPTSEVTPTVAAHALRKIMELETPANSSPNTDGVRETIRGVNKRPDTFLRIAFVSSLVDIICRSRNPMVVLDGLNSVSQDVCPGDRVHYKQRLFEELLDCVTDGLFSLPQICQAINILAEFSEHRKESLEAADKLWFGIMDKGEQLSSGEDIAAVFSTLPYLNKSRHFVLKMLEDRAMEHWKNLRTCDVIEIFRVLTDLKYERVSPVFLRMLSGWVTLHIQTLSEQEMLAVVWGFLHLDYTDDAIISAIEKTIKVKGLQIVEIDLISTICSYCSHFRIRSPSIFEGVSQYFIENHRRLEPAQVCAISQIFGLLDFHPTNGFKFWELMENYLEHKFVQFAPIDVINMLVSFIYIERYPLNFTNKLFNPFFLDRLHSQPEEIVAHSRQELRLFDTAMNLSCRSYDGPFLPKDTNYKAVYEDMRVTRLSVKLLSPLADVVGGDVTRLGRLVVLSSLPLHPLFIVDMMIYPTHAASLLRFGFRTNNSSNVAVLILTPEHYDRSGKYLMGAQTMRVRHLKLMGFKVMLINMNKANKLMLHPAKLREYLRTQYSEALKT